MGSPCHLPQNDHKAQTFPIVFPHHVPADDRMTLLSYSNVLQEVTPDNPFEGPLAVERGSTNRIWDPWLSSASFLPTAEHTMPVRGLT